MELVEEPQKYRAHESKYLDFKNLLAQTKKALRYQGLISR